MPRRRHALLVAAGFVLAVVAAFGSVPATDSSASARPGRPLAAPAPDVPPAAAESPGPTGWRPFEQAAGPSSGPGEGPAAPDGGSADSGQSTDAGKGAGSGKHGQGARPQKGTGKSTGKDASRRPGGRRPPKVAYLTFDDGPGPYTARVLSVLDKHRATATFFVLGSQARRHPGLVRRIRRQGSAVGFHSHDHPRLTGLRPRELTRQVRPTVAARCFRPPYGATDRHVRKAVRAAGMRQVLWTADGRDWERPGPRTIRHNSLAGLRPGAIILLHDGGGDRSQTVAALPGLLGQLRARGYVVRALPYC